MRNQRRTLLVVLPLLLAGLTLMGPRVCRAETGQPGHSLGCIQVATGGDIRTTTFADVVAYHEHPCPGSIVAFRAARYAIELLWDAEVPKQDDLVILCRGPMHGALDVFALVTKGPIQPKADAISQASPVLKEMKVGRESFVFTVIRRSTGEVVELRMKATVYPEEFFSLRKAMKQKKASPADQEQFKDYQRELIEELPHLDRVELFESPVRGRVVMFGA